MSDEISDSNEEESDHRESPNTAVHATRNAAATEELGLVFDLLQSPRRRYLLYYLDRMQGDGTTYDTAAAAVANYEAVGDDTAGAPSRESVRRDLHHVQFPRLEAADVVECDQRQEYVRFYGHDALEEWLEDTKRAELD